MPRARLPRYEVDREETKRIVELLRTVLRVLPVSNREIERRLGLNVGYLSRLFSGTIELKFEQIVAVCRAAGLKPSEFFELAYDREPVESETSRVLRSRVDSFTHRKAPGTVAAPPQAPRELTFEEQVHHSMAAFFAKILASLESPPPETTR